MARLTQNLTDIEYTLGSLAFSSEKIAEMLQYGGGEALQAALPYWGLLHSAINVANAVDTFKHSNNTRYSLNTGGTEKYTKILANLFSSAQLGYQSYQALASSSLGAFSPIFYTSFAINAGIDFYVALYDFGKAHREQTRDKNDLLTYSTCSAETTATIKSEALNKVIIKGLATIGWVMLACGNPMGWFMIAGGAALTAYFSAKNPPVTFFNSKDKEFANRPLNQTSDGEAAESVLNLNNAYPSPHQ